ncbi:MAG: metalloregulator ArsR/SmtB family transcription factor [Candidatus Aquicultor sp.]|nr:metalloregulator ArsR/SmtB family transcription factor [Candidatus Aquicultor sp.]
MAVDELEQDICGVSQVDDEKIALIREQLVSDEMAERLAETFKVLSDPTRVKVVAALLLGELCVCEISEIVGMSQSAVSHQLRKLKDLRLVKRRKLSKMVYYSLDDDHILGLITQGVDHIKEEFPGAHGAFKMRGLEGDVDGLK